jgi:hypothetical protein
VRSRNPDLFQSSDGEILRNTPKAFGIRFGSLPKSFFAHRRFFPLRCRRQGCTYTYEYAQRYANSPSYCYEHGQCYVNSYPYSYGQANADCPASPNTETTPDSAAATESVITGSVVNFRTGRGHPRGYNLSRSSITF